MSERKKDFQFLSRTELKALLNHAKTGSLRNYCMLLLTYRHGLRASEIVNTTMENMDLEAGNVRCERQKGSISNWQSLAEDEVKSIKAWLRKRPQTESHNLFVSSTGKSISRVQFFNIFRKLATEVGLPAEKRFPHILKRSLGCHLANSGVPIQVIQQRLGHRNIQNSMIYLQISSAYTDKAFESALANGAVV